MDPAVQAAGGALTVSLTCAAAAFVLWRRQAGAGGESAPGVAAPAAEASARPAKAAEPTTAGFEWPPRDVELLRYWSTSGGGLDSAARLLGASAMILWKADAPAGGLTPVDAYGYPAGVSAADPVAADIRVLAETTLGERRARSRATDGRWLVAIAVPVEHDGRILGVLTAELRGGSGAADADVEAGLARVAAAMVPALAAGHTPAASVGI